MLQNDHPRHMSCSRTVCSRSIPQSSTANHVPLEVREDLKPLSLSFTEIAKRVGESWQVLSPEGKEPYEAHASASKEKYNQDMASYKMTDSFREYQRYLADFRAKHGNRTGIRHGLQVDSAKTLFRRTSFAT